MPSLGVYLSVPFCRAKCSYCNFASGVFGAERVDEYIARVCGEVSAVRAKAARLGASLPEQVDSVYLGGGTPSLLTAAQLDQLFAVLAANFQLHADAEITLECAPGQLSDETLVSFLARGGNRVSLGVQSFIDRESKAVGRLHSRETCLAEIARLRASGIANINVDLIAGLPHQTAESWHESVDVALATEVPHISMYMLEVDEDSRLGREVLSAGERYGAATIPDEDEIANRYTRACDWLHERGIEQYEISNFARPGFASRHNTKYWRRDPYLGFGLDAHSMLRIRGTEAVRWANPDTLSSYLRPGPAGGLPILGFEPEIDRIGTEASFEETLFLGLRMNDGIEIQALRAEFDETLVDSLLDSVRDVQQAGWIEFSSGCLRLTHAGRMASNEVFERLLIPVT